ncbi:DUF7543 family protein [Salarchaeum japonicum]|uniref:DUF7543 family protein n=1 Tax=Salarchaeum japonicum TaxID=555573 RepID=UPI003C76839F
MDWQEVEAHTGRRWERADGYAVVSLRETAGGDWAVTYDRLQQAPEGETYERTSEPTESAALDRAEEYRENDSH